MIAKRQCRRTTSPPASPPSAENFSVTEWKSANVARIKAAVGEARDALQEGGMRSESKRNLDRLLDAVQSIVDAIENSC